MEHRLGKMDLKIVAIAISLSATIPIRNLLIPRHRVFFNP